MLVCHDPCHKVSAQESVYPGPHHVRPRNMDNMEEGVSCLNTEAIRSASDSLSGEATNKSVIRLKFETGRVL